MSSNHDGSSGRRLNSNGDSYNDKHGHDSDYGTEHPSLFNRIRASRIFQRLLRVLQFLSALVSLILFSTRIAKVIRLVHHLSSASGAVEGILAAAVLYTLAVMVIKFCTRGSNSSALNWILVVFDLLFVGGFIAVAYLTSPQHGGDSAACNNKNSWINKELHGALNNGIVGKIRNRSACNLPWGTFALAIVST